VEGGEINCLDVLPYVRLRVDHTHVRLFCATVYEHPVVLVQKRMSCVVLSAYVRDKSYKHPGDRLTGDCWPVAALFAKGIVKS